MCPRRRRCRLFLFMSSAQCDFLPPGWCVIVPLHLSAVTGATLPGKESERTVTGRLELPVRHLC